MDDVREIQCASALHCHNSKWLPYKYDINVYRGCSHKCIYCYAQYSHEYIDGGSFFGDIYAKTNISQVLKSELMTFSPQTVNLGGVCDSYQHAERDLKLMPEVLAELGKHNIPIVMSTKSTLILRDIDLLKSMDAQVAFTVTTMNETVAKLIEPGAPSPKERISAAAELAGNGIKTGIHLMPIIPYLTSGADSLETVFRAAKNAGADYVLAGGLNLKGSTRQGFFDSVRQAFPSEFGRIYEIYRDRKAYKEYKERLKKTLGELRKIYRMQGYGIHERPAEAEQLSFL
jgi:DNA repair photolyase